MPNKKTLVGIVISLVTLFPAHAMDKGPIFSCIPLSGQYKFDGTIIALKTIRYENVYGGSPFERKKLNKLKKSGYKCSVKKSKTHFCEKNLGKHKLTYAQKLALTKRHKGHRVKFTLPYAQPYLNFYNETVEVWSIPGNVTWKSRKYNQYMHFLYPDSEKIALGHTSLVDDRFRVMNCTKLAYFDSLVGNRTDKGLTIHYFDIIYVK